MKSILITVVTVGAAIAGLLLYAEQKVKRNAMQPEPVKETQPVLEKAKVDPLPIQSIP